MKLKRIAAFILAVALSISVLCVNAYAAEKKEFETAKEAVANMHAGVNIGNTLESYDNTADLYSCDGVNPSWGMDRQGTDPQIYETAWLNPVITKEYIAFLKKSGFDAIRLPVTWGIHCDKNGNVREDWLDRVQEVVDMILAEDMYCILNMHHEEWITSTKDNYNKNYKRFVNIWKNIAVRFKNYDEKLIFEGFNEMSAYDETGFEYFGFNPKWADFIDWYNKYIQLFVDTVRKTGGKNKYRNLLVNTYSASLGYDESKIEEWGLNDNRAAVNDFVLPTDSAQNHLIIGFHYYYPQGFTQQLEDWGKRSTWGTKADKIETETLIKIAADLGKKWNAPVVMGEFGAVYVHNESEIAKWASYVVKTAAERGIPCFYWDCTSITGWLEDAETFGLFDRTKCIPVRTEIVEALIVNGYKGKLPAPKLTGTKNGNSVTLKWDGMSSAYGYRIYEYDAKTKKYKEIAYIKGTKKTISGLSKGSHIYKIVSVAKYGGKTKNGSYSNAIKATV